MKRTLGVGLAGLLAVPVLVLGPRTDAGAVVAIERLMGADRFATAIAASQRGWPDGAPAVVLAGGTDHRDALAASGLAWRLGGVPVLLTSHETLREDVAAEIRRLGASEVVLVGGVDAIQPAVEEAVDALDVDVRRVGSATAPETAATVATEGVLPESARGRVFVVHSGDADAGVLAGSLAAARGAPVLLTETDVLPEATVEALDQLAPAETLVIGGPTAISDAVVGAVPNGRRIAGTDSYDVAVTLADLAAAWGMNPAHAVVAHGWADGVVAASLAGRLGVPLLLTDPHVWHGRLIEWFARAHPVGTTIVGGERAVDAFVAAGVADGGGPLARRRGDVGAVVSVLQQRLLDTGFNPDPPTGIYNEHTQFALWALQKAFDLPITGAAGGAELAHLQAWHRPSVLRPDITERYGDHVEISIRKQLLQVVKGGQVVVAVHTSTGKASTPTIRGVFSIRDHRPGTNALGMYKTMHFIRGYAIHGYPSVPLFPASHGCSRVHNRDADLLFGIIPDGMTVVTWL
jgi:putative cell wall-binding protein